MFDLTLPPDPIRPSHIPAKIWERLMTTELKSDYCRARRQRAIDHMLAGMDYDSAMTAAKVESAATRRGEAEAQRRAAAAEARNAAKAERAAAAKMKPENLPCVYMWRCVPTGLCYIGQSSNGARYREATHRSILSRTRKVLASGGSTVADYIAMFRTTTSPRLIEAYLSYPSHTDWVFTVLHLFPYGSTREVMTPVEISETETRNTIYPNGLNTYLGLSPDEETREKIATARRGSKASEETRRKMSESHLASPRCERARAKAAQPRPRKNEEEVSRARSERFRAMWQDPEWRQKKNEAFSARLRELWQDPEWAEAQRQKVMAAKAAKKSV